MNLILLEKKDFIDKHRVRLDDARFEQIKTVHGSVSGDTVRVGELGGLMGEGVIESINDKQLELSVTLKQTPPEKLPLTIILALPRPKMLKRIFRSLSELGVAKLIVINSYKVEKSFWSSPALAPEKVREYLINGLQQSKDTVLPEVSFKKLFKPFVEDELPGIIGQTTALVAHPGSSNPCLHQVDSPITLAIGPEGGFTPYEVEKLVAAGCSEIHLGERILRVENAITSLVAKLYS
jgi:16S rRNA (uracil1498-N3)-methyltransferase